MALVVSILAASFTAPSPAIAVGPPVSDDFSSSTLDPRWALVDSVGGSSVSLTGTNALISVPGGVSHDAWVGANRSPRLLQAVPDGDFEVEVKFESAPTSRYQIQGVIVEQDDRNYARFDFVNDGAATKLYAATITGGDPTARYSREVTVPGNGPVWLRVRRSGSTFSQSWSADGVTFNPGATFDYDLAVGRVGPFAGNHNPNRSATPAFTASVDYFFNTASPISSEDGGQSGNAAPRITAVGVAPDVTGAGITWTTDEPATSVVDYGTTAGLGFTADAPGLVSAHAVTLTGLTCDTLYHYVVRSADDAGIASASPAATFTTAACPPVSDDFSSPALSPRWALVDTVGGSSVSLTGISALISIPGGVSHDAWAGANRSARLLQPVPDGDFEVEAKFDSIPRSRYQIQGLILEQDDSNYARFDVHGHGSGTNLFAATVTGGHPTARYSRDVNVPSDGPVWLRVRRSGSTFSQSWSADGVTFNPGATFDYDLAVARVGPFAGNHNPNRSATPAFTASVDYFFNTASPISPEDGPPGGSAPTTTTTTPTTTTTLTTTTPPTTTMPPTTTVSPTTTMPPALGPTATVTPSANGSWIRWRTSFRGTTTVEYGPTPAYGTVVTVGATSQDHALVLTNLECATTYHYRAQSRSSGSSTWSANGTFTTLPCSKSITRSFRHQAIAPGASRPEGKAIADFDGDGLPDAAFGQADGSPGGLYWLRAPSWDRFTVTARNTFGEDMQAGDMDGDGDIDLVAGSEARGVRWFANPLGDGGNPASHPWVERTVNDLYTHDLELVDMDRDGRLDVVTEHGVYLHQASGSWVLVSRASIDRSATYPGTGVGDVNGDGFPDIVAPLPVAPYSVAWFENPLGSGRPISDPWTARVVGPGPGGGVWKGAFALTDVDRDGRIDIVVVALWVKDTGLRWFKGPTDPSGTAPWVHQEIDRSFTAVHTMKVLDVNGDGEQDLVLVEQEHSPQRRIAVMYGVDAGAGWVLQVLATTGGHNTKVGDIGNDGHVDLLVANHGFYGASTALQLFKSGPS